MKRLTNPHTDLRALIETKEVFIQSELLRFRKEKSKLIVQARNKSQKSINETLRQLEEIKDEEQKKLQKLKLNLLERLTQDEDTKIGLLKEIWHERKNVILNNALQMILPVGIREEQ
ncbi:MAG: hypothetical protein ACTSW1_00195 [Candidatus Hodarchaeales archaeon]